MKKCWAKLDLIYQELYWIVKSGCPIPEREWTLYDR